MTPDELARLRVPLDKLPGLDPTGLRVHHRDPTLPAGVAVDGIGEHPDINMPGLWVPVSGGRGYRLDSCSLDLSDASTADRVARWLAGRCELRPGPTAPAWVYLGDGTWALAWVGGRRSFSAAPKNYQTTHVAGLADLNGDGFSRLPDGSRFVDRLALALVAVHVGASPRKEEP